MDPRNGGPGSPYGFPFPVPPGMFPFHPQLGMESRATDPRYGFDPSRFMGAPAHGGSPILGDMAFGRSQDGGLGNDAFLHPAYRLSPAAFWDQMYRLHASSLRGMPIDPRVPLSPDYLRHTNAPPAGGSDMFSVHAASTTPSIGLPYTGDGSRLTTPRPASLSRLGRKRPLSISPFGQEFDLNHVIRMSPNSLISGGNGSRCSSSASGSYGHLVAGAMSPSMSLDPTHLHQFQQYMRQNAFFPSAFYPPHMTKMMQNNTQHTEDTHASSPGKSESVKRENIHNNHHAVVSSSINPTNELRRKEKEKVKKEPAQTSTGDGEDEDVDHDERFNSPKQEDDFVETVCRWNGCEMEFETQDELVIHVNQDHITVNKKTFVCRWKDCCREEKPFKAQYMLVVHMRRHTGEKPHRCNVAGCNKAYSRLENLKTHVRSHTGERPYMCEFPGCMKAFSNASDRAKHQNRTHSNAKPYICKVPGCTKRYTDPSSLRKHVKTVHGPEHFGNKKHKGNDVPRRNREDEADGHRRSEETRSSKSTSGSEPSTPRGNVKQESMEMSPSYSHPGSVFTNCSLDSPGSIDIHLREQNVAVNNRSNDPIAEEESEVDIPEPEELVHTVHSVGFGSSDVAVASRVDRYAPRGRISLKPSPPQMQSGPVNMSELNLRFTEMRTFMEPREQYFTSTQDAAQNGRRGSNASVSTYYSSIPSDGETLSVNPSRRVSVNSSMPQQSPPYDPISVGSSRRSSEPSLAPTLTGYQQKMHMRSMATSQRWQPTPQLPAGAYPNSRISQTPGPVQQRMTPSVPHYHGARRSSEPVGLTNNMLHRLQPLTRRNLQRHNSFSVGASQGPLHYNGNGNQFDEEQNGNDCMVEERENVLIPDDMVRYLSQVAEKARLERERNPDFSDDEEDDLPVIQQNYSPGGNYNQQYCPPEVNTAPPTFTSYPRSASYSQSQSSYSNNGSHVQHSLPQEPQFHHRNNSLPAFSQDFCEPNVYMTATMQRQRRGSLMTHQGCLAPGNLPRPLTEGSPDSYEVTSTTNEGRQEHSTYHRNLNSRQQNGLSGSTDTPFMQFAEMNGRVNESGANSFSNSNLIVNDMESLLSSLDHESRFLKTANHM